MKKKNGFFLAETIIMIALVTTVVAFLYPNVAKLYDNYSNKVNTYDQVNDIYTLRAIRDYYINNLDNPNVLQVSASHLNEDTKILEIKLDENMKIGNIKKLYISKYMDTPTHINYNFNKYLNRMKKTTSSPYSYRLIGIFGIDEPGGNYGEKTTYASIKLSEADVSFGGY